MSNQDIAVTRTMTTDPENLPSLFGTSLYDGLSPYEDNNIVVYGTGTDLLSSSESFIYTVNPRPRQGYAVRVSARLHILLWEPFSRHPLRRTNGIP